MYDVDENLWDSIVNGPIGNPVNVKVIEKIGRGNTTHSIFVETRDGRRFSNNCYGNLQHLQVGHCYKIGLDNLKNFVILKHLGRKDTP